MRRNKLALASLAVLFGLFSSDMVGPTRPPFVSEASGKWKPTPCEIASGGTLWGWFPCPIFDAKRMADEVRRTIDEELKLGSLMQQLKSWQDVLGSVTGTIARVRSFLNSLFSFGAKGGPLTSYNDNGNIQLPQVMASANPANVPEMSKAVADFFMKPAASSVNDRAQLSRSIYSDGQASAIAAKSILSKNLDEVKDLSEEIAAAKTLRDDFIVNAKLRLTLLQALEQRTRLVARITSGQAVNHLRRMGTDPFSSADSWKSASNAYGDPRAYANSIEREAASPDARTAQARSLAQGALNDAKQALNYAVELHNGLITGGTLNESIQAGATSGTDYIREELQLLSQRYGAKLDTPASVQGFIGQLVAETRRNLATATQIINDSQTLAEDASLRSTLGDHSKVLQNLLGDPSYQHYISVNPNVAPSPIFTDFGGSN